MATQAVAAKIAFGGVIPVLRVANVDGSVEYYTQALGFEVDFRTPDFARVSRGRCRVFLCAGDQGNPGSWIWIDGVDVERVYEELSAAGAKIRNPPTNYAWALEMQVEDLDGNVLRIGSDSKQGEPIGDWLDMHGVRHRPWDAGDPIEG